MEPKLTEVEQLRRDDDVVVAVGVARRCSVVLTAEVAEKSHEELVAVAVAAELHVEFSALLR